LRSLVQFPARRPTLPGVDGARIPERIVEKIRRDIEEAGLAPGTKLPTERELIDQMRVSRSSLREALRVLSTLGLVDIRHGDGIYVSGQRAQGMTASNFDPGREDALRTLVEARIGVEVITAQLAAERATEADFQRLERLTDEQEQAFARGIDETWEPLAFEIAVAEIADNPILGEFEHMLGRLWKTLSPQLIVTEAHGREWFAEHRAIIASMRSRNLAQVRRLVLAHVNVERFEHDPAPAGARVGEAGPR
jgi:GntR family transcriptional repressor for pyruvate dehydrogenase complex